MWGHQTNLPFLTNRRVRALLPVVVIMLLLIFEGGLSLKYMKDLANRSEVVYRETTKGSIELRLLEEQLRELETVYVFGLNDKSDPEKIKHLASETITNVATLIELYPEEPFVTNLSNQVVKLLCLFDDLETEGFQWEVMDELRERNQKIQADLITFKASRRLKGSSVVKTTEQLSTRSRKKFVIVLLLSLLTITSLIIIIVRPTTGEHSPAAVPLCSTASLPVGKLRAKEAEARLSQIKISDRELQVLKLMALGYSNKKIASDLFVAEQTVKNYVSNIYSKLGVSDRVTVSLFALKAGLIDGKESPSSSDVNSET